MRRGFLVNFFVLSFAAQVFATEKGERIKFDIIIETIHFLAQDPTISKNTDLFIDCDAGDYECVQLQVNNVIDGIPSRVQRWSRRPADSKEQLSNLKNEILADIIDPPAKNHRKNLPSYQSYLEALDSLIASFDPEVEMLASNEPTPAISIANDPAVEPENPSSNPTMLTYIALTLGGVALLLAIYSLFSINKKSSKNDYRISKIDKKVENVNGDFQELKVVQQRVKNLQEALGGFKDNVASHEARLVELENGLPPKANKQVASAQVSFEPQKEIKISTPNAVQLRYAKFLDLDNGFYEKSLKHAQDGEQTFEIKINGEKASYSVSNDTRAQKYALHNYEYLEKACEFENQPEADRHIKTTTNGELLKQGSSWLIQSKAIIRFD